MTKAEQSQQARSGDGFIAALDQSGGSTPKALKLYGIEESAYSSDAEMFDLIHAMRTRIATAPAFTGDKVIGAILFEMTMDRQIEGKPSAAYLWQERGVVPFLKIDKGLEAEADGAREIAKRARGTPRIAGRLLRRVVDFAVVDANGRITRAVADTAVGATVPVVLIRDGERVTVRVTIARRETQFALRDDTMEASGLTLQSSTAETKTLFGLPDDTTGVVVTHVEATSPLAGQLREGDVIMEGGWHAVPIVGAIRDQLNQLRDAGSGPVQILVKRDGRLFYAHIMP